MVLNEKSDSYCIQLWRRYGAAKNNLNQAIPTVLKWMLQPYDKLLNIPGDKIAPREEFDEMRAENRFLFVLFLKYD